MSKAVTFTAIAATALIGYAAYFDYTRRHSRDFRKSLKSKAAKQIKEEAKEAENSKKDKVNQVKEAVKSLENTPIPTDLNEKEAFFMEQVSLGEQLATVPGKQMDAVLCFYKALAVYPNPTDILGIYQKTIPEDVYELIIMMIAVKPPASIASVLSSATAASEPKYSGADLD